MTALVSRGIRRGEVVLFLGARCFFFLKFFFLHQLGPIIALFWDHFFVNLVNVVTWDPDSLGGASLRGGSVIDRNGLFCLISRFHNGISNDLLTFLL